MNDTGRKQNRKAHSSDEAQLDLFPKPSPHIQQVPLAAIDPTPRLWHVRRSVSPLHVEKLLDAIRVTGRVEPLLLMEANGACLPIVAGVLRYHAAVRRQDEGGPDYVPAVVLPSTATEDLLRLTILEGEAREGWSALELGWALMRLRSLLAEPVSTGAATQKECMKFLQLPAKRWKSRVSEALRVAEAIPESTVDELAHRFGCSRNAIAAQPRAVFRELVAASAEERIVLLGVLGESAASGRRASEDVRRAHKALAEPAILQRAQEALRSGASVSSVIPRNDNAAGVQPKGRVTGVLSQLLCSRVISWLARVRVWLARRLPRIQRSRVNLAASSFHRRRHTSKSSFISKSPSPRLGRKLHGDGRQGDASM